MCVCVRLRTVRFEIAEIVFHIIKIFKKESPIQNRENRSISRVRPSRTSFDKMAKPLLCHVRCIKCLYFSIQSMYRTSKVRCLNQCNVGRRQVVGFISWLLDVFKVWWCYHLTNKAHDFYIKPMWVLPSLIVTADNLENITWTSKFYLIT